MRAALFALLIAVAVPISLFKPFWGMLMYLGITHIGLSSLFYSTFQYGMILVAAIAIGYFAKEFATHPLPIFRFKILTVLVVWIVLSGVFAYYPVLAERAVSEYVKIYFAVLLIAAMANTEERVGQVLTTMSVAIGLLGAKTGVVMIVTGFRYRAQGPTGMVTDENDFALALNMAIPILFFLARIQEEKWKRWSLQALGAGTIVAVIGTRSRSGLLGLIMALLLLTFYSKRKLMAAVLLPIAAGLFLAFAPSQALDRYKTIDDAHKTDESAIGRLEAWQTGWRMMNRHPVFGVGPKNFVPVFNRFSEFAPRAPHNAYVALGAESGLPAAILFFLLLAVNIFSVWRLRKALDQSRDKRLVIYCLSIQATLMVYLIPILFINRQNYDFMYYILGAAAGLHGVAAKVLAARSTVPSRAEIESREPLPESAAVS